MTAREFVRYMPAEDAVALCWAQLVAIVGEQEASEMVGFLDLSEVQP